MAGAVVDSLDGATLTVPPVSDLNDAVVEAGDIENSACSSVTMWAKRILMLPGPFLSANHFHSVLFTAQKFTAFPCGSYSMTTSPAAVW